MPLRIPPSGPGSVNHSPIPRGYGCLLLIKPSHLPPGTQLQPNRAPCPRSCPPLGRPTSTGQSKNMRAQQRGGPSFPWLGTPWEFLWAGALEPHTVPVLSGLSLGRRPVALVLSPLRFFLCKTKSSASTGCSTCCKWVACWAHLTGRPVYLICGELGERGQWLILKLAALHPHPDFQLALVSAFGSY